MYTFLCARVSGEGKGITKWVMVGAGRSWKQSKMCFSFPSAFKIYANLWEGKNLVISNQ
jgi:hypothetical protein